LTYIYVVYGFLKSNQAALMFILGISIQSFVRTVVRVLLYDTIVSTVTTLYTVTVSTITYTTTRSPMSIAPIVLVSTCTSTHELLMSCT